MTWTRGEERAKVVSREGHSLTQDAWTFSGNAHVVLMSLDMGSELFFQAVTRRLLVDERR